MKTNLRIKFSLIAWGVLLPAVMTLIITLISIISPYEAYDTLRVLGLFATVLGILCQLSCLIGAFMMIPDLKKHDIPTSGAICIGIAFAMSFIITILSHGISMPFGSVGSMAVGHGLIFFMLTAYTLLLVGINQLSAYIRGLSVARVGMWMVMICLLLMILFTILGAASARGSRYYSSESAGTVIIAILSLINMLVMLAGVIVYICGWFKAIGGARDIDEWQYEAEHDDENRTSTSGATASEILGYQASLRLLSDEQLNYILANPSSYTPAYVSEATKMLAKRQSWERINAMSDEQLFDIVEKGLPEFSNEECDVASMVLFTRRTPRFMTELQELSTDDLRRIADNPLSYYEGHVAAAREILVART